MGLIGIIVGAVVGLLAGSFIATLAIRWPLGESALGGRSRCDQCRAPIGIPSLVPLFSYTLQRGRARCCGARIDPVHPIAEILATLIGAFSAWLPWEQAIASAWLGWSLLALALIDARTFRLPNLIVVLLGMTGLAFALRPGGLGPVDSLIGAAAGFVALEALRRLYRALRRRDGIGGGDPKLLGAIGAWVGWEQLPLVLVIASVAGLLVALAIRLGGRRIGSSDRLPLGTFLALAAWPVWLWAIAPPILR